MYIEYLYLNIIPVVYLIFAHRFAFGPMDEMARWKNDQSVTWAISFFTFWAWFILSCTVFVVANRFVSMEWNWIFVALAAAFASWVPTIMLHVDPAGWRFTRAVATFPEPTGHFRDRDGVWKRK